MVAATAEGDVDHSAMAHVAWMVLLCTLEVVNSGDRCPMDMHHDSNHMDLVVVDFRGIPISAVGFVNWGFLDQVVVVDRGWSSPADLRQSDTLPTSASYSASCSSAECGLAA